MRADAVADAASCRARVVTAPFDAVVCDLYLDGEAGPPALGLIEELIEAGPPVVVYSTWALDPDILTLLDIGVRAYLQKASDIAPLVDAVSWAMGTDAATPPLLNAEVAGALQRRDRFGLTPAELEVLTFVSQHLTYAEIAALRFVSEDTVKTQISSIRSKLGAPSRSEAVRSAHRYGLLGRWHRRESA